MMNKIIDEYTDLPISNSQRWRLRHPDRNRQSYMEQNKKRADYIKNWYLKHKVEQILRGKIMKRKMRRRIIKALGDKCIHCGFSDWRGLQIDHVHGGGRKDRARFTSSWSYYNYVLKAIKSKSKDYQLLCANCNQIKEYDKNGVKER